ncbi:quorum-sensing autoinducer CAI-1 synthase [Allokutzneria sp. A3M-2-11 16]|uniref:alpha-hydroxyketone-type quorum-sensing autoinducer synthase n=1 Tax=Allokutzneria sp. A3M-2-11 16 TaxID=2962043 RepID=UPI0020B6949D|nr:alpha-hydroxyketone-type quorum-sensing autoinducer synthase [Allokutzneria sp. A3M-2-11 16]MCP3797690.1 quorum-sensing autoinducer CAI-1 synthase [Allokutzneria sp. A3M-2-11 16]
MMDAAVRLRADEFYRTNYLGEDDGRGLFGHVPLGPDAILLHSNDYLDIGRHPRIVEAQIASLREVGSGALMSGVYLQDDDPQPVLQRRLAQHVGAESVLLCQSGWAANTDLLQAIARPGDTVFVDSKAHQSLREGVRIAGATPVKWRHNTPEHLDRRIRSKGPGIIVVDSIYSLNGTICPLADIVAVAREHGCVLVVDESHSLGVYGPDGGGLVHQLGLAGEVDFVTASLSKAFVTRAGLIACANRFTDYIRYTGPQAIFSSALLPHDLAGLSAVLDVVSSEEERRLRLHKVAERVRGTLLAAGVDINGSQAQIISLVAGEELQAMRLRDELDHLGVHGSIFIPPATSEGGSLLRLSLHAGLGDADVDRITSAVLATVS